MTLVDSEEVDTLSAAAVSKEYQTLFWVPMLFQTAKNAETMIEDMLDLIQDFHDQTLSNSLKDNDGRRMSSDFHKAPGQHKRRQQILGEKLDSEVNTATRVDVVLKSENSKYILLSTLKKHFLFSQLRDYELDDVIDVMQALYVPEDEVIIQEGDAGDMFYILEEGAYEVLIGDEHVATCEAPQPFGDLALMYNAPRAATIKAIEPCTLWTLDRVFFRQAMVTSSSNQNVQLSQFLSKITLFETIGVQKLNQLARSLTKQSYDDGQYIIKQGDIGDQFYVLYKGQVKVSMTDDSGNEKYLLSLHEGEVFGERALIRKEPRKANIVAEGAVECYYLEAHDFYSMLGEFVDKFTKINEFRILRGCDVFSKLSDYKLKELLGKLTMHRMFSGQRVVCDYQEIFFVIDGVYESTHGTKYNSDNVQIGSLQQGAGEVAGALTLFSDEGQLACIAKDVIMTAIAEDALEQKNKRNSFIGGSSISSANSNSSGMSMLKMDGNLDTEKEIQLTRSRRKAAAHQRRQSLANNICESLDGLELIQPLGKGTFGSVFLCQHKVTRKLMALKCLDKRALVDSGQHHYVRREIIALSNFQHPFLSEYYGAVLSARKIFFVLEFISGGELWSYLYDTSSNIKKGPYGGCELQEATLHAATVILALEHIHGLGYSYRDLKPENLLISSNGYLKLVDFGFAKQVPFEGKNQQIQYRTFTLCGTPDYMAPELVLTQGHDKSADYWAYGVLLYEMIRGDTPFSSNNQQRTFEKIVHSQKHLSFPPDFNPHCKSLIRRLLHPNAALRLGALQNGVDDIKNHAFFTMQGLNFTKLLAQEIPMSYIPPVFVPGKSDMCGSTSIDHMDLDFEKNMDVDDDLNAYFETLLLNVDEVTEE